MKDIIGLIHPKSSWHNSKHNLTDGRAIIINIKPCLSYTGWYSGNITHPNLYFPLVFINGFRPRRVK